MNTYEQNERAAFNAQLSKIETAPLSERQEARKEWAFALRHEPEVIAQRCGWMINGDYGKGAYDAAREVAVNKRMNRAAWFGRVIAALEWQCPARFSAVEYKRLTPTQQAYLTSCILKAINKFAYEYVVEGLYSGEWEEIYTAEDKEDALARLAEYRTNEPGAFRMLRKAVTL